MEFWRTTGIGLLETHPSREAMEECDTLLMVATSFPYIEFLPKQSQARGVQIDLDPMRIGLCYPVEVRLVGDSRRCSGVTRIVVSWRRLKSACAIG
jgi:pyruvate dehydrogenase (quinone)